MWRGARLSAEHELARAYNNGKRLAHRKALDLGLVSEVEREWVTKRDEQVCPICSPLDGRTLRARVGSSLYNAFAKGIANPPAHIRCRCTVIYQVVRTVAKHLPGQHNQKTHGRRYSGEVNDLILDILGVRKGPKREPSAAELKRIREHVAKRGFPTTPTKVSRRLDGTRLPDGTVLRRGDAISPAKEHWAYHVVEKGEWPPGTTQQDYEEAARQIVLDPDSGIFASFHRRGWHLAFVRESRGMKGPAGFDWAMVEYRMSIERQMTAFQPEDGLAWLTDWPGRKRKRWLKKPKGA